VKQCDTGYTAEVHSTNAHRKILRFAWYSEQSWDPLGTLCQYWRRFFSNNLDDKLFLE